MKLRILFMMVLVVTGVAVASCGLTEEPGVVKVQPTKPGIPEVVELPPTAPGIPEGIEAPVSPVEGTVVFAVCCTDAFELSTTEQLVESFQASHPGIQVVLIQLWQ